MKMNKKGFTLIELLAVIVILAIIALIATPIIMGIIDDAKKNSARNSAYGYLDAIDKSVVSQSFTNSTIQSLNGTYEIKSSGSYIELSTTAETKPTVTVTFKGDAPTKGTLIYTNGVLQANSTIKTGGYGFTTTGTDGKLSDTTIAD